MAISNNPSDVESSEATPEQIVLVRCVIAEVQAQLRALRELAFESHDRRRWSEHFPALAQCVCERMHMALDDCMTMLGEERYDNYRNAITKIKERRDREG